MAQQKIAECKLTKAHFVSKNTIDIGFVQRNQPIQTAQLIIAHFTFYVSWCCFEANATWKYFGIAFITISRMSQWYFLSSNSIQWIINCHSFRTCTWILSLTFFSLLGLCWKAYHSRNEQTLQPVASKSLNDFVDHHVSGRSHRPPSRNSIFEVRTQWLLWSKKMYPLTRFAFPSPLEWFGLWSIDLRVDGLGSAIAEFFRLFGYFFFVKNKIFNQTEIHKFRYIKNNGTTFTNTLRCLHR